MTALCATIFAMPHSLITENLPGSVLTLSHMERRGKHTHTARTRPPTWNYCSTWHQWCLLSPWVHQSQTGNIMSNFSNTCWASATVTRRSMLFMDSPSSVKLLDSASSVCLHTNQMLLIWICHLCHCWAKGVLTHGTMWDRLAAPEGQDETI